MAAIKKGILFIFAIYAGYCSLSQDSISVSNFKFIDTSSTVKTYILGSLKDLNGSAIINANVHVKGASQATITDANGNFRLEGDRSTMLSISNLGYALQEIEPKVRIIETAFYKLITDIATVKSPTQEPTEKGLEIFPVPYPAPSATYVISVGSMQGPKTAGDLNSLLVNALDHYGYDERRYYYVDNGFALVTQMEQTDKEGYSLTGNLRWSSQITTELNTPWQYLKALFNAPEGYFRVIAILVSDRDLRSKGQAITVDEAQAWLNSGYTILNKSVASMPISPDFNIHILVYQYHKSPGTAPEYLKPGTVTGKQHFQRSRLSAIIR